MAHPIISQIESLIPRYCSLTFDAADALAALGTVTDNADPRRVVLRPRAASCDRITLAYVDWPLIQNFLGGIEFSWTKPQRMQLAELRRAFGPLRILSGHDDVAGPDSYCFEIRRQPLQGVVVVEATPERRGETLLVESLTLRRMAPDPYSLEEGRAVRLVVFADFGATQSLSDVTPLASNLWKHAGLGDLIGLFAPQVEFEVANHLGHLNRTLSLTFRPGRMEDFTADGVVRSIPELAAFVDLREALVGVQKKKVSPAEFGAVVDLDAVPQTWKRRAEEAVRAAPPALAPLLSELDAALSRQCEAVFANERLKTFQADWLGLQFVASNMDFASGSRIEVYTTPSESQEEFFREGLFEAEHYHRLGVPPILAILGEPLAPRPEELERLKKLSALAAQIETPVAFGIAPDAAHLSAAAWSEVATESHGAGLIGCAPRICLRPGLEVPGFAPTCFHFTAGDRKADTTVWGSGAWTLGALLAANPVGPDGFRAADLKAKPPPLIDETAPPSTPLLAKLSGTERSRPGDGSPFTVFTADAEAQNVSLVQLRALYESKAPLDRLVARFVFAPLVQTVRRIQHRHANETNPERIPELVRQALLARIPGAEVHVEFRRAATISGQGRWRVRVTPPFQIEGQTQYLSHATSWE